MKLEINHTTRYSYFDDVTDSINEVRLTPRTNYRQACYHHSIVTDPLTSLFSYEDFFGNRVYSFSVTKPHKELTIKTHSIVVTQEQEPKSESMLLLTDELAMLRDARFKNRYAEFLQATAYVDLNASIREYAGEVANITQVGSVYDTVRGVTARIYQDFSYQPGATSLATTAKDTLSLKRGVCQDFAHLMLALCRVQGIPARYISGYHFVGDLQGGHADFKQASHAWVEAFIPGIGWLGFDPTNNGTMNWRYVKLGHGRDYNDIVPIKGVYSGAGCSKMEVIVDVRKIEDETCLSQSVSTGDSNLRAYQAGPATRAIAEAAQ